MALSIMKRLVGASVVLLLSAPLAAGGNTGTVAEVLDSDVVRFGDSFVARLVGVSAPPKSDPLGARVFEFTRAELEGELVTLFTWTTDDTAAGIVYDDEGRAFVQIHYGEGLEASFNELLLEKGFAEVDEAHLPADLAERYRELERAARQRGVGLWESGESTSGAARTRPESAPGRKQGRAGCCSRCESSKPSGTVVQVGGPRSSLAGELSRASVGGLGAGGTGESHEVLGRRRPEVATGPDVGYTSRGVGS